jgi:hypothetical protein
VLMKRQSLYELDLHRVLWEQALRYVPLHVEVVAVVLVLET